MTMISTTKKAVAAAAMALTIAAVGAHAASNASLQTYQRLSVGTVDISLSDNVPVSMRNEPYEQNEDGSYASDLAWHESAIHSITITNNSEPCWIRVSSTLSKHDDAFGALSWPMLDASALDPELWIAGADGFFYLKAPLDSHEQTQFAEVIRTALVNQDTGEVIAERSHAHASLDEGSDGSDADGGENKDENEGEGRQPQDSEQPDEEQGHNGEQPRDGEQPSLSEAAKGEAVRTVRSIGGTVTSTIRVDAVQKANVTPDFASDTPWGDITATAALHTTTIGGAS